MYGQLFFEDGTNDVIKGKKNENLIKGVYTNIAICFKRWRQINHIKLELRSAYNSDMFDANSKNIWCWIFQKNLLPLRKYRNNKKERKRKEEKKLCTKYVNHERHAWVVGFRPLLTLGMFWVFKLIIYNICTLKSDYKAHSAILPQSRSLYLNPQVFPHFQCLITLFCFCFSLLILCFR